MAVVDNTSAAVVKASRSTMTVSESQGIRFNAVDTTLDPADATNNSGDGALSNSLQAFVISDTATDGTFVEVSLLRVQMHLSSPLEHW